MQKINWSAAGRRGWGVVPPNFLRHFTQMGRVQINLKWPALAVSLLLAVLGGTLVQADSPNRVALVVVHANGDINRQCVEFSESEITGMAVLQRSGLDLNVDAGSGMGGAVCRLDGEGCTYPADDCFCQCKSSDSCVYWSYWYQQGGNWQYSGLGAANFKVKNGDVQGWVWGKGAIGSGGTKPPAVKFDDVCAPPPTSTATPLPTDTPTPAPTHTPTPVARPVIHNFAANQTTVVAGQPVQLSWDLSGATAAYLRYNGQEQGVVSPGSISVTPAENTVYTLVAKNEGGETSATVSITVSAPPTPAVVAAAAPPPTNPAPAAPAALAPPTDTPAATSAPEPVISFSAASLSLPAGACTNLSWRVENASAVFLADAPVAPQATTSVCPAQTQTFRLRAVYPAGEKSAELTLAVTAAPLLPTDTPSPATEIAVAAPTAPPATAAAAAPAEAPAPRRFAITAETAPESGGGVLWYVGVAGAVGLFVLAPLALLVAGWVAWWLKGSRR